MVGLFGFGKGGGCGFLDGPEFDGEKLDRLFERVAVGGGRGMGGCEAGLDGWARTEGRKDGGPTTVASRFLRPMSALEIFTGSEIETVGLLLVGAGVACSVGASRGDSS